jgi:hypothetical protein
MLQILAKIVGINPTRRVQFRAPGGQRQLNTSPHVSPGNAMIAPRSWFIVVMSDRVKYSV